MDKPLRSLFWKSEDNAEASLKHFSLRKNANHYVLKGVILCNYSAPTRIDYKVTASHDWHTQSVELSMLLGKQATEVRLDVTSDREWLLNGKATNIFFGLIDVDLGITPATNSLPINRLNLSIGESTEITAVWIRFPEITIEPLPQRYTRLTQDTYKYENLDGTFSANIIVDKLGIVKSYGNMWTQVQHP
jgi:uncharacterized protein